MMRHGGDDLAVWEKLHDGTIAMWSIRAEHDFVASAKALADQLEWSVDRVLAALNVIAKSGRLRIRITPDTEVGLWDERYPSPVLQEAAE